MRRLFLALSLIVLVLTGMPGDPMPPAVSAEAQVAYDKACRHYENRARFKPRDGDVAFVVVIADTCRQVIGSAADGKTAERLAAMDFLNRLVLLRDTVIDINMNRLFGLERTPFSRPKDKSQAQSAALGQVSASGEFLIAHRMGLIAAWRAWRAETPDIALAARSGF